TSRCEATVYQLVVSLESSRVTLRYSLKRVRPTPRALILLLNLLLLFPRLKKTLDCCVISFLLFQIIRCCCERRTALAISDSASYNFRLYKLLFSDLVVSFLSLLFKKNLLLLLFLLLKRGTTPCCL
ncbi:hypothetical protein GIB67_019920, partial [Kingdonia uniflora]